MIFLIVPYIVKDNRSGVLPLQYTGKVGRRYDFYRILAVLLTSGIVFLILLPAFLWMCRANGIFAFWNSSVSSFSSGFICWFPLKLGQLILLLLAVTAMLATGLVLFACLAVRFCTNYITAMAWMLPVLLVTVVFCGNFFAHFMDLSQSPWLAIFLAAGILLAGIVGNFMWWMFRNKKQDALVLR